MATLRVLDAHIIFVADNGVDGSYAHHFALKDGTVSITIDSLSSGANQNLYLEGAIEDHQVLDVNDGLIGNKLIRINSQK